MSQRELAFPRTLQSSTRQVRLQQNVFSGMNEDDPASLIGAAEVVRLVNLVAYGSYAESRTGSQKLSSVLLPAKHDIYEEEFEFTFRASKAGTTVTSSVTGDFANLNVGDFFRWSSDGLLDQVTEIDGDTFESLFSETRAEEDNCTCIEQPFGAFYHDKAKAIYLHLGNTLYKISTIDFGAGYSRVLFVGSLGAGLARSQTRFRPSDDDVLAFNANGIFRIIRNKPFNHYFKTNAENPSLLLDEVEETNLLTYGRQAIYSLSRIVGGNFNEGRLGTGSELLQESSPCQPDETTRRDTAKVFTSLPVGLGSELNYRLTSKDDSTDHISNNAATWEAYLNTHGFKVRFNSKTANIRPDFTGVTTMFEVADRLQLALRVEYPKATARYYVSDAGNPIIEFSPGEGGTIEEPDASTYPNEAVIAPDAGDNMTNVGALPQLNILWMNYTGETPHAVFTSQAKAPVNYGEMAVPDDGRHFTHFTLWTTVDIGAAGVALKNKTEKLIFNKDVPIIRPFTALWSADAGQMSGGPFHQADVGSNFRFYDGSEGRMDYITATYEGAPSYEEEEDYAQADTAPTLNVSGPCAFGAQKISKASQSGNIIELATGFYDTYTFSDDDAGKIIFLEDGTLRHIVRKISDNKAEVQETGDFTDLAIGWDYEKQDGSFNPLPNRSVRDNVTDKILKQRGSDDDFVLQTRYYEPLPSSSIGEMANNFVFVAPDNSTILYYGAVPLGKKHRLGYYHPGWQKDDNTEDVITYIKRYADRIVCFCRRSTWASSMATINSMDTPDIGEKIFLLPHMALLDNIGLVHTGSLQDIGIGQSVMITHEPAIRAFDGRQYGSKNLAAGIMTYITNIARIVYTSYDPYGGYLIYCTMKETEHAANKITPANGLCFHIDLDVANGAGQGWAIYGGPNMVMPMPLTEGLRIENAKGYLVQAILDQKTGKWFNISTFDGPEGSDMEEVWVDREGDSDEAEIQGQIILREDRANPENEQLEFLTAHIYLRPTSDSVDGDGNPTYRTGQAVNCRIYNDGRVIYTAQTLNIPIPGDVSFDRKSQGPRIQTEFILAVGQVQIVGIDRIYASRDKAGNQALTSRSTQELNQQREYAQQILWLSRGRQPLLNRSIGNVATGDGPESQVQGPDGVAGSAMSFDGVVDPVIVPTYQALTGDMTIQFGFRLPETPEVIPPVPPIPDGSEWEGLDFIGNDTTKIVLNRTEARFDFVVGNVARAWLNLTDGWTNVEPATMAPATEMAIYYDQNRACWIFWIDGNVVGVLDGNVQVTNFRDDLPGTYNPALFSWIDTINYPGKMAFFTMTTADPQPRATGYIDDTGYHDGAPA